MNLKSILGNTRKADLSFHRNGLIEITSRIVKALGIHKGDVIDVMSGGGEYYIYVSIPATSVHGRHEGICYPSSKGNLHFRAYSRRLCAAFLPADCSCVSFAAGDVTAIGERKAIPIITRNIIRHEQD